MPFSFKVEGLQLTLTKFKVMSNRIDRAIDGELQATAFEIQDKAKLLVPVDMSKLKQSIEVTQKDFLYKQVSARSDYAAYVEFGTGKYAARYVPSLPQTWQQAAMQFKGKGRGGDYFEFLNAILDWVKRKHLAQIKNSYTGRKSTKRSDLLLVAETIAWSIIKNGIRPHPFFYPAVRDSTKELEARLKRIIQDTINKQ